MGMCLSCCWRANLPGSSQILVNNREASLVERCLNVCFCMQICSCRLYKKHLCQLIAHAGMQQEPASYAEPVPELEQVPVSVSSQAIDSSQNCRAMTKEQRQEIRIFPKFC